MKIHLLLPLICMNLMACAHHGDSRSITIERLSRLSSAPDLKARWVSISCKIYEADGTIVEFPRMRARMGKSTRSEIAKEFIFPTDFELLKIAEGNHSGEAIPITPTMPTEFEVVNIGDFLTLTPRLRGPFVEVLGNLTAKSATSNNLAAGEVFSAITNGRDQIVLTDNKVRAPEFQTIESTIRVCGTVGVEHRMRLNSQNRSIGITVETLD